MSKFFKERKSPWFLRKDSDGLAEEPEAKTGDKKAAAKPEPQPEPKKEEPVKARVDLFFGAVLGLGLVLLPFYFLPPIFPRLNFYFWREVALISLSLLLLAGFTLRLLTLQKFSLLKGKRLNTYLGLAVLLLFLSVFFSQFRLGSLTRLETWTYAAWALVLFVLANNQKEAAGASKTGWRQKLLWAGVGLSALVVLLAWVVPFTPLFGSLPPAVSNNVQKPALLDWRTSWNVAIESFKDHPLTGIGPGLFAEAFQAYKPAFFNASPQFNLVFYQTHWPFLGTLTTQGMASALVWVALTASIIKLLAGAGVGVWQSGKETASSSVREITLSAEAARIGSAVLIALMIVVGALLFRVIGAEFTFRKALAQVNEGQIGKARQTMGAAINQNIYEDHYRRTYISLSRAMVDLIAQQNRDKDGKITAAAQKDITALINQNVQQSQVLTQKINPLDARNWQVRGDTYRGLIGAVSGADKWAVSAYQQAVQLSPTNPFARIALGGVYLTLGSSAKAQVQQLAQAIKQGNKITFNGQEISVADAKTLQSRQGEQAQVWLEQAAEQFRLAAVLKADLANAYYNWAAALNALDKKNQAQVALQQTLSLVKKDSPDYEQVKKDLEKIQKDLGVKVPQPGEQEQKLRGGKEVPQPTGQLLVPTGRAVPLPTSTPTPTFTPTPTPTPTQVLLPTFTPTP